METLLKLSPAQTLQLRTAARRPDGRVIPPDTLRGGARVKVLTTHCCSAGGSSLPTTATS